MSTTVWSLLAMCVVAWVIHRAPVVSQCTSKHCHDGDRDVSTLTSLVDQLQDTVERQQVSAEQQQQEMTALKKTMEQDQQQNQEQHTQLATLTEQQQKEMKTLKENVEQQRQQNQEEHTQLATLKETVEQQQQQNHEQHTQLATLTEQLREKMTTHKVTVEQQQEQLMRFEDTLAKQNEKLRDLAEISVRGAHDCADLLNIGMSTSGVYSINVAGKTVPVWCDMSGGKGWLVFQRRVDNTTDFYRDWKSYKNGFGNLTRNFWLGNDNLHAITAKKTYTLRVDLADFEGKSRYAEFTNFAVASEDNKYRLTVGSYSGTAGNALNIHNGKAFSTRDSDNDTWSDGSCAQRYKGAWWYSKCHDSNLNGLYLGGANIARGKGIIWPQWHGGEYSLKTVAMKIRPQ